MPQVICHIKNGKIVAGRDRLIELLGEHEGKDVLVTVDKFGKKRTAKQLAYYWSAMIKVAEKDLGWEPGTMHEYFKLRHNPVEVHDLGTGEIRTIGGSTQEMDVERMQQYISSCVLELAEIGYHVDTPEEYYKKIRGQK